MGCADYRNPIRTIAMKTATNLAVLFFAFFIPPVSALNCSLFDGNNLLLCGMINPLALSEDEKTALMQPGVYGEIEARNPEISMKLNIQEGEVKTTQQIYDEYIGSLLMLLFIIFINYFAFSMAKNSSFLRKWLNVDS